MNDDDYPVPVGFVLNQVGDNAPTPEWLWREIASYFYAHHDLGMVLDPCAGDGRLYNLLRESRDWCEIQLGKNYYDYEGSPDTIMTNSPWTAQRYTDILRKMLEDAQRHLILLGPLRTLWGTRTRAAMMRDAGLSSRTLIRLPPYPITAGKSGDFTMGGIQVVIAHWQRGYSGDIKELDWSHLTDPSRG